MPIGLSTTAKQALERRNVQVSVTVKIAGAAISSGKVQSWSWSASAKQQASATVVLVNRNGEFSSGSRSWNEGDTLQIIEALEGESFPRFYGIITKIEEASDRGSTVTVTALDALVKLKNTDIERTWEGSKASATGVVLRPTWAVESGYFWGTVSSVSSDTINYNVTQGEEYLSSTAGSGLNWVYNRTRDSAARITSVDTGANQLVFDRNVAALGWSSGDDISNKCFFSVFEFGHTDIATDPAPQIFLQPRTNPDEGQNPVLGNIRIERGSGQAVFDYGVDLRHYRVYARRFWYYTSGVYVEDIIVDTLTEADAYGNVPFSSSDLQTDFQSMEGSGAIDHLTPAASDSGYTDTWYLSYDHVITDLGPGDFSVPGGASVQSVDKRSGTVTLDTAISTSSDVTCNTNYTFWTVQSTGIQVPLVSATYRRDRNRWEFLRRVLQLVPSNYKLHTRGDGKVWGRYLSQKTVADDESRLPVSVRKTGDVDTYTRVRLYAKAKRPDNILRDATVVGSGSEKRQTTVHLQYDRASTDFLWYRIPNYNAAMLFDPLPVLKVDGVTVGAESSYIEDEIWEQGATWDTFRIETGDWDLSSGMHATWVVHLSHKQVLDTPRAYNSEGDEIQDLQDDFSVGRAELDRTSGDIYFVEEPTYLEDTDTTIAYNVYYPSDTFTIQGDLVKISRSIAHAPNEDGDGSGPSDCWLTYSYLVIDTDVSPDIRYVTDTSLETQKQWVFVSEPSYPFTLMVLTLPEPRTVELVDITGGFYRIGDSRKYGLTMRLGLQYLETPLFHGRIQGKISPSTTEISFSGWNISSLPASGEIQIEQEIVHYSSYTDNGNGTGVFHGCTRGYSGTTAQEHGWSTSGYTTQIVQLSGDWLDLCAEASDFELTGGQTVSFDRNAIGESKSIGALRLQLRHTEKLTVDGQDRWVAAIAGMKAFRSVWTVAEAKLTSSESSANGTTLVWDGGLGLVDKYGDRLFKKTMDEHILFTKDELELVAGRMLREFVKEHTKVDLREVVNPSWELGWTIHVVDTTLGIDRNYFVESISTNNGELSLTLGYYP